MLNLTVEAGIDPSLESNQQAIQSTISVAFVGFTILVYDHLITFADELQFIWYKPKRPLMYLFLLNRYLIPLGFIVNLFAYLSPIWTTESCTHFVRYEGSMTVIGINVVALMMLLRIRAMYNKNLYVVGSVALLFAVELSVNAWLLSHGEPVNTNHPISCTMIFEPKFHEISSASAWLPLLYDTVVLILTFYRTSSKKNAFKNRILDALWAEGLMYYGVIFSVTLILTIMISAAPPDIQNICAQLELLLTVAMMSRITLDLKREGHESITNQDQHIHSIRLIPFQRPMENFSTIVFQHHDSQNLNVAAVETSPTNATSQWGNELEMMGPPGPVSPERPRPGWWSMLSLRAKEHQEDDRVHPISIPRVPGEAYTADHGKFKSDASEEWVEMGDYAPPLPRGESRC